MPPIPFEQLYGHPPAITAHAPGRVNLMGDHTDYQGGVVLPAAIPQRTTVDLSPRRDAVVRVWSGQYPDLAPVRYRLGDEVRDGGWADYVKGMTRALAEYGRLGGFDARVLSTVPVGSGLASSAALEIALGRALREAFALRMGDRELARAGRRAENDFVGAPVGIMDQMACSLADTASALLLDTRTLEYVRVPLPSPGSLIVIHSGVAHRHAGGAYQARRRECGEAAAALGVAELRDVDAADLPRVARLPEPLAARARHVITENARVHATADALRSADLPGAGRLFLASHASLRDDFQVSTPEIDELVSIASRTRGVYGARLTGGGFGGSIVALADAGRAREAAGEIVAAYDRTTGCRGAVFLPIDSRDAAAEPSGG
jgi:galactokinase